MIAELTEAGDLLQASKPSFPAEVTTTTPMLINEVTAALIVLLFELPSDMSENQRKELDIAH